ncbi:chemotaxis protein CheW [Synechococcus sp. PCC 6716]|nr:chemotaxis protein CheW [Synechococcus sp. PCC 6716]
MATGSLSATEYFHVELPRGVNVAIPLDQTAEVLSLQARDICLIPGVSPALLGISNQRGHLLWMLDLLQLLGLDHPSGQATNERLTALVVREATPQQPRQFACIVSRLRGIMSVLPDQLQPVPKRLQREVRQYLAGFVQMERLPILLLNIEAIFQAVARSPLSSSALSL